MAVKKYLDTAGLQALWSIINTRDNATQTKIATLIGNVTGDDAKSVRTISAEEVAKIVADADTDYDTLKEIADWIKSDPTDAAQMANDIESLKTTVGDSTSGLVKDIADINSEIGTNATYASDTDLNPATAGTGVKGRVSALEHNVGQVTSAILPIANTLTGVKGALGTQDDTTSATYTGANATNTKTAFARIKALEEANANADTIEAIPTTASSPATGNSIAEICVFTYGQS